MNRATIDFGIDLGTTNSSIAVLEGTQTRVIKNNANSEITPSVVWIDKKGRLYVGLRAKEQREYDSENAYGEFKLRMGDKQQVYHFAASGRQMSPEDLSAEVLKSLRADVKQHMGEEIIAAAITVPAIFAQPQSEATNRAAQLAGLSLTPILQEPVAAGLAYGFQSKSDRVFWVVFDFGGGTFDAAIIGVREGTIQVVNHDGDNQLGGKLIDWEIVNQLLVPALQQEYALPDFRYGNPRWKSAFAKLKLHAEEAKIELSRQTETEISIDPLCQDEQGKPVRFEYELHRSDIEPLIEPFVERAVNKCRNALEQARLSPGNIEKLILVGGPTLTPIFREMLSDKLRIPLEFSVDPLTVVACGAAIFAGTQRIPDDVVPPAPVRAGQYKLELDYEPIGSELEPQIGGRVIAPQGESLAGFTIEFVESKGECEWRSGKIDIGAQGTFTTTVTAEEGRKNEFLIELKDGTGNIRETVPDRFTYTPGIVAAKQSVINSFAVVLATGETRIYLKKGTPLPSKSPRGVHLTTTTVKRGDSGTFLRIPIVEGENTRRADRNRLVGALEVRGDKSKRDLPAGSEVEVTIEMDESRLLKARAYVPLLDEEFEVVMNTEMISGDPQQMADEFEQEKARLEKAREKAQEIGLPAAEKPLQRIRDEHMIHDVETALDDAKVDHDAVARDAADRCQQRLRELKSAIDEAEDAMEWPTLVSEAESQIELARKIVDEHGDSDDRRSFNSLESGIRKAIASRDADLLHRKVDELGNLRARILQQQPGFWVGYFRYLAEEKRSDMRDRAQAERLIAQGNRAIDANDINELRTVVIQLVALLPVTPSGVRDEFISTLR